MRAEYRCPKCGAGATAKRSVIHDSGTSNRNGKSSWIGLSLPLSGRGSTRVFLGKGSSAGTSKSQFAENAAPFPTENWLLWLILIWGIHTWGDFQLSWIGWVYGILALIIVCGFIENVGYYRDWMCRKCGETFRPDDARSKDFGSSQRYSKSVNEMTTYHNSNSSHRQAPSERSQVDESPSEASGTLVPGACSVEELLTKLQHNRTRATYGAVGGLLGVPAISVGKKLGSKRPLASWVVSKSTGMPSGYTESECHPQLTSKQEIIDSPEVLARFLASRR